MAGETEGKGKTGRRRIATITLVVVLAGIACVFLLALLGPAMSGLFNPTREDLADEAQCIEAVQALNTVEEAQPALGSYEVPQGLEIVSIDNVDSLAELERFTYEEPSLSQALRFEGGELLVVENEDWRSLPTAISPDGGTLVRIEGRPSYSAIVRICDVSSGEQVRSFTSDETTRAVAFTPDGERFILNEGRGTIAVRDVAKRRPIAVWDVREGEQWKVTSHLAVSPNGELAVFSVAEDDSLRVWDIAENDEVAVLEGHSDSVIALSFNAEGSSLASYGMDGVVRVWGVR